MDQEVKSMDLKHTFSYIHSELNRIQTMAGTLSTLEREHYNKLTNFDHRDLLDMAVEEQSAARQLGEIKQMCLALAQKVEGITNALKRGEFEEASGNAKAH
jgi:myo-inositol catabolism protein IolC